MRAYRNRSARAARNAPSGALWYKGLMPRFLRLASAAMLAALAALSALPGCGAPPPPQEPAEPSEPPPPPIALMNATVVVESCPNVTKYNARMAENAIRKMIEPCTKVPGGAARFTATMVPGGNIKLASPSGDVSEGVVPTCVVTNELTHKVLLRKPCVFRIELEDRTIPQPPPAAP